MTVAVSSIIHNQIFKNTVKFLVAISIPVGIVWAFIAAKTAADKQYESEIIAMKAKPTGEGTVVKDYELKEVDDNNTIRWQLVATKGSTVDNKHVSVEGVKIKYFDGPNVKMLVSAPIGNVDGETRFVKLMSQNGHRVHGEGEGGKSVFDAETIELDKQNQFFATGGVIIEWAEVAKVTGNEARGKLDKGGFQNVKIVGHTHAVIAVK
jgi:hypothetical protein